MPTGQAKTGRNSKTRRGKVVQSAMEAVSLRENMLLVRYKKSKPDLALMLTAEFRMEGDQWLAECVETGVATFGPTLDEARSGLIDAMAMDLECTEKLGFLADYLEERKIRPMMVAPPRCLGHARTGNAWAASAAAPRDRIGQRPKTRHREHWVRSSV